MQTTKTRDRSIVNIGTLHQGLQRMPGVLKRLGYSNLRQGQDDIVYNVMGQRDTIGFLPTATGKSATFIVPALCLDWKVLVFSPLVALMQDQVQSLWRRDIKAGQLSGTQSDNENRDVLQRWVRGELQFLYIAPERMKNQDFMAAITKLSPDLIVVDEAHSIAQWGTNFRPQYAKIGGLVKLLDPKVILAITATATADVEQEIRSVLHIESAFRISYMPERTNLKLSSSNFVSEAETVDRIKEANGPSIVYCATKTEVESLCASLDRYLPGKVTRYHGGLSDSEKKYNQARFMEDVCSVCVATNAFGMGIDKPNIRGVFHYDHPGTVEALTQEVGRAGRDGLDSTCHTFYRAASKNTHRFFADNGYPDERTIRSLHKLITDSANAAGHDYVEMSMKDMSFKAGMGSHGEMKVGAAISIMIRNGVLERPKSEDKIAKIRFKQAAQSDDRMSKYWNIVEQFGSGNDNGFIEISMDLLSTKIGLSEATVRNHFKAAQVENLLDFIPPFKGTPTYVKGPVDVINFPELKQRYREALKKIDDVVLYINTPDKDKHTYLRDYFADK